MEYAARALHWFDCLPIAQAWRSAVESVLGAFDTELLKLAKPAVMAPLWFVLLSRDACAPLCRHHHVRLHRISILRDCSEQLRSLLSEPRPIIARSNGVSDRVPDSAENQALRCRLEVRPTPPCQALHIVLSRCEVQPHRVGMLNPRFRPTRAAQPSRGAFLSGRRALRRGAAGSGRRVGRALRRPRR